MITFTHIDSPVGPLLLAADETGLRVIEFHAPRHPIPPGRIGTEAITNCCVPRRRS
jgi:hypothetical protein